MYEWLSEAAAIADERSIELAPPATESELAEAERRLGISLPASYRAFLARSNGADIGARVLSLADVLRMALDEGTFRAGDETPCGSPDDYYAAKPASHLFIVQWPFGSDGYCLATDQRDGAECSLYWYDAEDDPPSSYRFPDFEAFVHEQLRDACSHEAYRERFEKRLRERGVAERDDYLDDYSGWRHGDAAAADPWPGLGDGLDTDVEYLYKLAQRRAREEDHVRALALFDKLLVSELAATKRTNLLYDRARSLDALGRFDEAIASFDQLIALEPTFGHIGWRATSLAKAGRHREVIADCDALLALEANATGALMMRAESFAALGENARALADIERLIRLDPKYADDVRANENLAALRGPELERVLSARRRGKRSDAKSKAKPRSKAKPKAKARHKPSKPRAKSSKPRAKSTAKPRATRKQRGK